MKPILSIFKVFIAYFVLMVSVLHGAGTATCSWKAGYFNAFYQSWYGHGSEDEKQRIIKEIMNRTWVIIKLDSLIRSYKNADRLSSFPRWTLIDNGSERYRLFGETKPGTVSIKGTRAYLNLADSQAASKALVQLWGIESCTVHIGEPSGTWLYALHSGTYDSQLRARFTSQNLNFDDLHLWLSTEYDEGSPNTWYQHETDGYYHRYYGLFLSSKDVYEAQEWFLKKLGWKTTITSHYLTTALLKKYVFF